jgi:integrase/recombinase XerD
MKFGVFPGHRAELELPRMEKRLPQAVLFPAEIEKLLAVPNVADPLGIRDRAMLELFYSCGVRRAELCRLELADLNTERKTIHVRLGKGKKDRMVPVGERASSGWNITCRPCVRGCAWTHARKPCSSPATAAPSIPMSCPAWWAGWIKQVTGRVASCHLIRHTCATHMLENGADIRFIQQLLGHAKLDTTAIYTEVSIKQLQEVHARCHPSARLSSEEMLPQLPPVE